MKFFFLVKSLLSIMKEHSAIMQFIFHIVLLSKFGNMSTANYRSKLGM